MLTLFSLRNRSHLVLILKIYYTGCSTKKWYQNNRISIVLVSFFLYQLNFEWTQLKARKWLKIESEWVSITPTILCWASSTFVVYMCSILLPKLMFCFVFQKQFCVKASSVFLCACSIRLPPGQFSTSYHWL